MDISQELDILLLSTDRNASIKVLKENYMHYFNGTMVVYQPKFAKFVVYGFVIPVISGFGIFANLMNGIVLMRPKMTSSTFTYLTMLSWFDCISCIILCATNLSRTLIDRDSFWIQCDMHLETPIFGLTTGAANLILAFVAMDRLIYLKWSLPNSTPKFCTRRVARTIVVAICVISTILNIPYFFITAEKDGVIVTTDFFHSKFYMVHNWINFLIVAVFPAIFLIIGNGVLVFEIRKWAKCPAFRKDATKLKKRYFYQIKLTSSLVAVICLFYIGDIPAHLVSRKSAISLIYGGDATKYGSDTMEIVRMVVSVLNAFQLSVNIVVYALLNPVFMMELIYSMHVLLESFQKYLGINMAMRCIKSSKNHLHLAMNLARNLIWTSPSDRDDILDRKCGNNERPTRFQECTV